MQLSKNKLFLQVDFKKQKKKQKQERNISKKPLSNMIKDYFLDLFFYTHLTVCGISVRNRVSVRELSLNTKLLKSFSGNSLCLSLSEISFL